MVLSEQKCDYTNMDELGALQDSVFTPTLNAFVSEGKLIDWGVLVHEWGDGGTGIWQSRRGRKARP